MSDRQSSTDKPKITVIMPSLNVAQYIEECVQSVCAQTLTDMEILAVDAGSTDGTLQILEDYARRDSRIRIIRSEKKSYGYQVNLGLVAAKGAYIGIIETDDFTEPDMFQTLYDCAVKYDLDCVKSNYWDYAASEKRYHESLKGCQYETVFAPEDNLMKWRALDRCIWTGLYKKAYLDAYEIRFLESPGASYQDNSFWVKTLITAPRTMYLQAAFLNYRRDNAASSVKSREKVYAICEEVEECRRYMEERGLEKFCPYLTWFMSKIYAWNLQRIAPRYREEFLKKISEELSGELEAGHVDWALFTQAEQEQYYFMAKCGSLCLQAAQKQELYKQADNAGCYGHIAEELFGREQAIYLYGAGRVGQRLKARIERCHPQCEIQFLVSDRKDAGELAQPIEQDDLDRDRLTIIAVADANEQVKMLQLARERGLKRVLVYDEIMRYILTNP